MYVLMDGRIDDEGLDGKMDGLLGLMDEWTFGWTEHRMEDCMNGILHGWIDEWMDGWMDGCMKE